MAPVRLHVVAKRSLCAREPDYRKRLSEASQRSLVLQGGAMSEDELAVFEAEPYWRAAVAIRRWDDGAKVPGRAEP